MEIGLDLCVNLVGIFKTDSNFSHFLFDDSIGDLVTGSIDIAIAAMTMTSERAEAVDFVAPYFDQVCNLKILS